MIDYLHSFVSDYGLVAIFFFMATNGSLSFPPSEIILPLGGVLASSTHHSFSAVILVAMIGNYCGAVVLYLIGLFFGYEWLLRVFTKKPKSCNLRKILFRFLPDEKNLQNIFAHFPIRGRKWVFVFRFLPVVRSLISLPAGMAKMRFYTFTILSLLGMAIWNIGWISVGYFAGLNWIKYKSPITLFFVVVLFMILIILKHRLKEYANKELEQSMEEMT